MKNPGDCAYRDDGVEEHRWVIVAMRGNEILLVNITSIKPDIAHDPTCILGRGDWPVLTNPSYVIYQWSQLTTIPSLKAELDNRAINIFCTVPAAVLARMQKGCLDSIRCQPRHKKFMADNMPPAAAPMPQAAPPSPVGPPRPQVPKPAPPLPPPLRA
jgi:hypothetical protein